ncbi:PQQ-dependent dehydrogenase, methanol/ethanol family [Croceibacterium salegens]|nr:PQQ-dependent dehydrogenase, methanol/ethanol family [Croceibacterium salegens]
MNFAMWRRALAAPVLLALASCQPADGLQATASAASDAPTVANSQTMRALDAPANVGDWLSYSRGWDEQRHSPLTQINEGNVGQLGLAWYDDLGTFRGVQASPLVIDGVLYNESIFNVVTAYDATNGKKLWTYDPKVDSKWARLACCGPSSRGIAAWHGKLYVGALDGRVIAIDQKDGHEVWSTATFDEAKAPYSITGAPRVYDGKVVIGNGGADYGSRGFVIALDAETGKKAWKFYLVPGDPSKGPDGEASDEALAKALPTWSGKFWEAGGGGNAWDSFAYDPDTRTVIVGTGNGSPHMWHFRSEGKGDNLFLCSMLALDIDTGKYKWHYQEVPEEDWDYTCTQPILLADIPIDGKTRKVAMQAPKNGFFYVVDRTNGQLISAKSYVSINTWASHVDMATGRPVLVEGAHNTATPHLMSPSWLAAHTWHPMSYDPKTGLVYFSAQEQGSIYARAEDGKYKYTPGPGRSNSGQDFGSQPELRRELQSKANATEKGYLLAWDPRAQTEAWRVPYAHPGSGGVLTTASGLLVQGTIDKTLAIYRDSDGKKLWEMNIDQAPVAGPITYMVDGVQYIAINAGWGGSPVYNLGPFQTATAKLLVFKLGGTATLPPMTAVKTDLPAPPPLRASEAQVAEGRELYGENCSRCHGGNAVGGVKDLRFMTADTHREFADIVLGGKLSAIGMASFKGQLSESQVEAIHAFLIARGNEDYRDATAR